MADEGRKAAGTAHAANGTSSRVRAALLTDPPEAARHDSGDPPAGPDWTARLAVLLPSLSRFPWLASRSPRVRSDFLLVATVFVGALACHCFSERIPVNGGLGSDGVKYGAWSRDFYGTVIATGQDDYNIQRVLPSAVVHYTLRLLRIPLTDRHIIRTFGAFNVLLLSVMAWIWCLVVDELAISPRGKWLGCVGLFVNYAVLKWTFYYPVLTDVWAYCFGMTILYFYLSRRTVGLCAATLLGAFVWPTLLYLGALLLLFPRQRAGDAERAPAPYRLNTVLALTAGGVLVIALRHLFRTAYSPNNGNVGPVREVMNLSIAVSFFYLFFAARAVLNWDRLFNPHHILSRLRVSTCLLTLAVLLGVKYLQTSWSTHQHTFGLRDYFPVIVFTSALKPGLFYVGHVVFYGPVFLLALFLWRPVCGLVHAQGLGLTLCVIFNLFLSLDAESRHIFHVVPVIVAFVVKAVDALAWSDWHYGLVAGLSAFFSKVWLTINTGPFRGSTLAYPDQLYYMSVGPWMSDEMYLIHGAAVLVAGYVLYSVCLRGRAWRPGVA